jgi:hypothetical protein
MFHAKIPFNFSNFHKVYCASASVRHINVRYEDGNEDEVIGNYLNFDDFKILLMHETA